MLSIDPGAMVCDLRSLHRLYLFTKVYPTIYFRCVLRFPSTMIKIMFQSLVGFGEAVGEESLNSGSTSPQYMSAKPLSLTNLTTKREFPNEMPTLRSPGANTQSQNPRTVSDTADSSTAGLRIHIPPSRLTSDSLCNSPTGTIRSVSKLLA